MNVKGLMVGDVFLEERLEIVIGNERLDDEEGTRSKKVNFSLFVADAYALSIVCVVCAVLYYYYDEFRHMTAKGLFKYLTGPVSNDHTRDTAGVTFPWTDVCHQS